MKNNYIVTFFLLAFFVSGCATVGYPKASEDADEVIVLKSNIQKTDFYIDGKLVVRGKLVKVLINDNAHTIVARPVNYNEKEYYVQPPYEDGSIFNFYFLKGDKKPEPTPIAQSQPVRADSVTKAGVNILKYKKVAVIDFESAAGSSASGKEVADIMSATLMKKGFSIVERSKLNKIMDEHSLSLTGLTDSSGLVKLGKMAGASAIVMGNVSAYECKGEKCRVSLTAKMIDVETGELVWSGSGSGQGTDSPQSYASAILEKITKFH